MPSGNYGTEPDVYGRRRKIRPYRVEVVEPKSQPEPAGLKWTTYICISALIFVAWQFLLSSKTVDETAVSGPTTVTPCKLHNGHDPVAKGLVPNPYGPAFAKAGVPKDWDFTTDASPFWLSPLTLDSTPRDVQTAIHRAGKLKSYVRRGAFFNDPKVINEAIIALHDIHNSVHDCFPPEGVLRNTEQYRHYAYMTKDCKRRIKKALFGAALLGKVEAKIGQVGGWKSKLAGEIAVVRDEIRSVRGSLEVSYQQFAGQLRTMDPGRINAEDRLKSMQRMYLTVVWLDFRLTVLDRILQDRAAVLERISYYLRNFAVEETKLVGHSPGLPPDGSIDAMPDRAINMLQLAKKELESRRDQDSYRDAASAWLKRHIITGKRCTCNATAAALTRKGHAPSKEEESLALRKGLDFAFWETQYLSKS